MYDRFPDPAEVPTVGNDGGCHCYLRFRPVRALGYRNGKESILQSYQEVFQSETRVWLLAAAKRHE
jgi:hypothetical protein